MPITFYVSIVNNWSLFSHEKDVASEKSNWDSWSTRSSSHAQFIVRHRSFFGETEDRMIIQNFHAGVVFGECIETHRSDENFDRCSDPFGRNTLNSITKDCSSYAIYRSIFDSFDHNHPGKEKKRHRMIKRVSSVWRTRVDRSIISRMTFVEELFQFGPAEDNVLLSVVFFFSAENRANLHFRVEKHRMCIGALTG